MSKHFHTILTHYYKKDRSMTKTFKQFREDCNNAIENLMLEAKGFGDIAKRRRESKKKRQEYIDKRTAKVKKLKRLPNHWSGLE